MLKVNKDHYFLMIPGLNLCPTIKTNTIQMVEQIMNASILLHQDNIQLGINTVLDIKNFCKSILKENYLFVLEKLQYKLDELQISIAKGEEVCIMYPKFHKLHHYYYDVGKQAVIDMEFALQKKIHFNGSSIKWLDTYIYWIQSILTQRRDLSLYNPQDLLLYSRIEPKTSHQLMKTEDIILKETKKYVEEYKKISLI